MATLKNTTINDTGFLTLPTGNSIASPGQGQIRLNPATRKLELYNTRDAGRWSALSNPFLTRSIITTGYLHGGYASSTVWNNTNRVTFATDTTVNLGDGSQEYGHNYQCSAFNRTRNFTFGGADAHCTASNRIVCFNMRTETKQTSGYTRTLSISGVNSGCVQQEEFKAWYQNTSYANYITQWDLVTETETGSLGANTATLSGQLWGTNHDTFGIFWNGSTGGTTFTFATRTTTSRGTATSPSGDGNQKTIQFKQGFHYAGREGNPSTNWRKTNMFTNSSADAVGAKPYYSGEENMFTGQDWGYAVGWYQGSHVNTAFKFVYASETGYGTSTSLEAKGKTGNSSATMSWRDN